MQSIVDTTDPEVRNLCITQSYYQLTHAVGQRLGGADVPWTGFAVWASKTAGMFIRRDWLPERLFDLVAGRGGGGAARLAEVDRRLKEHVARGNRAVYAEIGPLFAELIDVLDAPASERPALADALIGKLRPEPVQAGGQAPLIHAMRAYIDAAACDDDRLRAQKVLLANIWIGYQEQWRLQPEIMGSLGSAFTLLPAPRSAWQRRLHEQLTFRVRQLMTRIMRISIPNANVRLGRDVPAPRGAGMFPPALEQLALPPLQEVVREVDRTPDTTSGSAAADWASFDDRMNFLVDLFRAHQRSPDLWNAPFSPAQVQALERGELPAGNL